MIPPILRLVVQVQLPISTELDEEDGMLIPIEDIRTEERELDTPNEDIDPISGEDSELDMGGMIGMELVSIDDVELIIGIEMDDIDIASDESELIMGIDDMELISSALAFSKDVKKLKDNSVAQAPVTINDRTFPIFFEKVKIYKEYATLISSCFKYRMIV